MATITPLISPIWSEKQELVGQRVVWTLGNADVGVPVKFMEFTDKSFQADSVSWGGATVVLEGSNLDDGSGTADYITLNDPTSNPVIFTGNNLKEIMECTMWVRARSSGGTGSSIITSLVMRRTYR